MPSTHTKKKSPSSLLLLVALLLFLLAVSNKAKAAAAAAAGGQEDHEMYDTQEGEEEEGSQMETRDSSTKSGENKKHHAVALTKEERVTFLEDQLHDIVESEVKPAATKLAGLAARRDQIKRDAGWFASTQQKESMRLTDDEIRRSQMQLDLAKSRELATYEKLKPLYGIVSYQFFREQQSTIASSLKKVNEMSYNQAWWSTLFNNGRAESLTDLILQFFVQWLLSYVIMYPFAVAYYAIWSAPWSIYSFSSGYSDVIAGVIAWLTSVLLMLVPIIALISGAFYVSKKVDWRKFAEDQQQRRQARDQQRYQQQVRYGY